MQGSRRGHGVAHNHRPRLLTAVAALTASPWIPHIVCLVMTNGFLAEVNYLGPEAAAFPTSGRTRPSRLSQRGRNVPTLRGARSRRPCRRQGGRRDGVLDGRLFLSARRPRNRLLGGRSLCADFGVCRGLCRGDRHLLKDRELRGSVRKSFVDKRTWLHGFSKSQQCNRIYLAHGGALAALDA